MCGIAGIAVVRGNPPLQADLKRMCETMIHRGPDDEGIEIEGCVGLGMRRLSIIDVAGGHQPVYNEDKTVRVVFNGEIYNYREIRQELSSRGHVFRTSSDSEVIAHAYEEYGPDFPVRLNGMFAIALHDTARQKIFLVRDHLGIKPLYYAWDDASLAWGSEFKVVMASGRVERELDHRALAEFLAWEYIPGEGTLFTTVRKLKPAHILTLDLTSGSLTASAYWNTPLPDPDGSRSVEDYADLIDTHIRKSVRMQMVSDVPLGAFLSGGVDSSLVVSAMGNNVKTFSIGFDDPTYNELNWSRSVAQHLKVHHRTEVLSPDIKALFDQLMYFMDDPIGDFSIFPTYLVSKLARQDVTVCLSGDGGDELFAGYETYLADDYARRFPGCLSRLASCHRFIRPTSAKKGAVNKLKRFLEGYSQDPVLRHARWRLFVDDTLGRSLFRPEVGLQAGDIRSHIVALFEEARDADRLNQCLYTDIKSYLTDNILVKVDRMSMAASLESRVPLLDKNLVELAASIPAAYKLTGSETKAILKRVAARHVPPACIYRPKQGFSIPVKNWLKTTLRPLMLEALDDQRLARQGLFDPFVVQTLIREHMENRQNHSHVLWALIVFQCWHQRWVESS